MFDNRTYPMVFFCTHIFFSSLVLRMIYPTTDDLPQHAYTKKRKKRQPFPLRRRTILPHIFRFIMRKQFHVIACSVEFSCDSIFGKGSGYAHSARMSSKENWQPSNDEEKNVNSLPMMTSMLHNVNTQNARVIWNLLIPVDCAETIAK